MLSKCANPECSEIFRYLHQGKIFYLAPTPDVQNVTGTSSPSLQERFWLCDRCSKEMTVIWDGSGVKVVQLPVPREQAKARPTPVPGSGKDRRRTRPRRRAAAAGRDDG